MRHRSLIVGAALASAIASLGAQAGSSVQICVGADRVLRAAEGGGCKPGERSLGVMPAAGTGGAASQADLADYKRRLAQLEERVRALEEAAGHTALGKQRVTAPFEVVDRAGKVIFKVVESPKRAVELYNVNGAKVAVIEATDSGGRFATVDPQGHQVAALVAYDSFSGVAINEDDKRRLELGRGDKGNYRLVFLNAAGERMAAIGEPKNASGGAAYVGNRSGAGVDVTIDEKGSPQITILSARGIPVAQLRQEADGGGALTLTNASGVPMVDAGVISNSFGVVRAGPGAFKSGLGVLGLPGSYIAGKPDK